MRIKAVKIIAFLLIGALLFTGFWRVFRFKQDKRLEKLHDLPKDSVDVLFVGSSHAFMNIDPSVLWRESGVSGYVLGSGDQLIWHTYHQLKALKTQSPKVVFVECFKTKNQQRYSKESVTLKAAIGMPLARNYLEMLDASVKDRSNRIEYILRFPWFHTRYREITPEDYLPDYGNVYYRNYLGYYALTKVVEGTFSEGLNAVSKTAPLTRKVQRYLKKIVKLSKERGFDLVFLITPFWKNAKGAQDYYNTLARFAEEQDVPLLNCNLLYDEIGMDADRDFSLTDHLSIYGAEKVTKYLNDYINAHWALADHRGDGRYAVWDGNLEMMEAVRSDPEAWETDTIE